MQTETDKTGVIYIITNLTNNKKYIGKAFSYVKNGNQPIRRQGAEGRFYKHLKAAMNSSEIPLLYDDIRKYGQDNFKVETLEICLKEDLKKRETYHINNLKTYDNSIGYNYLVGDNKPKDDIHKQQYEANKIESNKTRAIGGGLRQSIDTTSLPPNIYKRKNGYFAQIKLDSTLYNKAFLSSKFTDVEKLEKAIEWLDMIKSNSISI